MSPKSIRMLRPVDMSPKLIRMLRPVDMSPKLIRMLRPVALSPKIFEVALPLNTHFLPSDTISDIVINLIAFTLSLPQFRLPNFPL